jgi:hypothetical protein
MRILHLPTLAVGLSIAGLTIGGLAAYGGMHDTAAAAALAPAAAASPVVSSACQELPVTSTAATPSASASGSASPSATAAAASQAPTDLCISVQAGQDSVQAGQEATWTVEVWVQNGPVSGVTVSLTSSLANQLPTFTSDCPGGNGNTSCAAGDLGTSAAPASQEMATQITVPSGTSAGTSVALTATANATPSLGSVPAASTAVTVAAAASASASASASPSSSATPAKTASPSPSPAVATTRAATTPPAAAVVPGVGALPTTGTTLAPTEVSEVTDPGSISSLLPVVTPGTTPTPTAGFVTSPAADSPASPGATDKASDSSFVLILPIATAEKVAVVVLLLLIALALRMRANKRLAPHLLSNRAPRAARTEDAPSRHRRKPLARLNLRRRRGGS